MKLCDITLQFNKKLNYKDFVPDLGNNSFNSQYLLKGSYKFPKLLFVAFKDSTLFQTTNRNKKLSL